MRLLHTSDWHLGRSFHGEDLLTAQATYADHLIETVEAEQVDVVVVSGDVYDRALPPVDAVALADETFHRLASSRARVVVTSGNHDSARRLGFNSRLVDLAGIHVRTDPDRLGDPVVIDDVHGTVAIYGLPFLEPDVLVRRWGLGARSHQAAMGEAMRRVRADLDSRPGVRSVVLAHAFVAGGVASDSERDISVGGVSQVPVGLFDGIDYTALGHLHGRATLRESVRYSGSPIAYSFSEAGHLKGSWLVELDAEGVEATTFIEAPVPRALARIEGSLERLLTDPALIAAETAWVQATLTDPARPAAAMDRLRARFPHALALRFAPVGGERRAVRVSTEGKSAHEIALGFVEHVRGGPATEVEAALLGEALECCPDDQDLLPELLRAGAT
jgi:DNA repair protein SbcD/Mre11